MEPGHRRRPNPNLSTKNNYAWPGRCLTHIFFFSFPLFLFFLFLTLLISDSFSLFLSLFSLFLSLYPLFLSLFTIFMSVLLSILGLAPAATNSLRYIDILFLSFPLSLTQLLSDSFSISFYLFSFFLSLYYAWIGCGLTQI